MKFSKLALMAVVLFSISISIITTIIVADEDENQNPAPTSNIPSLDIKKEFLWTNKLELSPNLTMKWDTKDENYMTVELTSNVQGYLGIGFSRNGGMVASDIILCWVDNDGTAHASDYFAYIKDASPIIDEVQDVTLIEGEQTEAGTRCVFKRKWVTCDPLEDFPISQDTVKLIWAVSSADPKHGAFKWHGKNRGVKSVSLRRQIASTLRVPQEGEKYWDVQLYNHPVTDERTQYHCKMFKFPTLSHKHHITGYLPLVAPEHRHYLHRIALLRCHLPQSLNKTSDEVFEELLNHPGGNCFGSEIPAEWLTYCLTYEVSLTFGSEGEVLPDHVGNPIGGDDDGVNASVYFVLQVHYENSDGLNFNDSSGIRVLYNENVRQFESSTLFLGQRVTPFMMIPPKQQRFKIKGVCSRTCTQNGFPEEGVKAFTVLLHGHLYTKSLVLRHVRNGIELPPLSEDRHYDFNYQQYQRLPQEVIILPGDELILECEYDNPTDDIIVGGLSSNREMCQAMVMYYPKASLVDCRSQYEFHSFFNNLGIHGNIHGKVLEKLNLPYDPLNVLGDKNASLIDDAMVLYSMTGVETLNHTLFDDLFVEIYNENRTVMSEIRNRCATGMIDSVQTKWAQGPQYIHCGGVGGRRIDPQNYIQYIPKFRIYAPPQVCDIWKKLEQIKKGRILVRKSGAGFTTLNSCLIFMIIVMFAVVI